MEGRPRLKQRLLTWSIRKPRMEDYRFLEHTADLKFQAYGSSLSECFINSARALFTSIVDLDAVGDGIEVEIEFDNKELSILLHDFLSELLYLFETEYILFSRFRVTLVEDDEYRLDAKAFGERLNREKHVLKAEIKAVTFHELYVRKEKDGWVAQVLCDI